jgi:hypothetical protein
MEEPPYNLFLRGTAASLQKHSENDAAKSGWFSAPTE